MALLVGPNGRVLGVEKVPELAARSVDSIQSAAPGLLAAGARAGEGARGARGAGEGAPLLEIVHGNALSGER
jgi:hypothetical protein